jgi:hypothetical protein
LRFRVNCGIITQRRESTGPDPPAEARATVPAAPTTDSFLRTTFDGLTAAR